MVVKTENGNKKLSLFGLRKLRCSNHILSWIVQNTTYLDKYLVKFKFMKQFLSVFKHKLEVST